MRETVPGPRRAGIIIIIIVIILRQMDRFLFLRYSNGCWIGRQPARTRGWDLVRASTTVLTDKVSMR